jgi:hypothetical protein
MASIIDAQAVPRVRVYAETSQIAFSYSSICDILFSIEDSLILRKRFRDYVAD